MAKSKRRFAELAHVAQIFVGLDKPVAAGGGRVSKAVQKQLVREMKSLVGMSTVLRGRGEYTSPQGEHFHEPSLVLTAIVSGTEACAKVHRDLKKIAMNAAQLAQQTSVLALTHCANGRTEADMMKGTGEIDQPIPRIINASPASPSLPSSRASSSGKRRR